MFKDIDISTIDDELQDELEQQSNIEINDDNEIQSEENLVSQRDTLKFYLILIECKSSNNINGKY